jgi:predicted amidohydrolase YtcJ
MIYVNSAALKLAGIDANTPDPEGGSLGRGTDGIPNGLLLEPAAMNLVTANFPAPTAEEFTQAIPDIVKIYLSQGVTSAHDAAIGYTNEGPQIVEAYVNLHNRGQLGMRVYLTCMESFYSRLHDLGIRGGFGSDRLRFGGVKMFQDGSIQIGTAALSRDYFNREGYKGHLINPQEQLDAQVSKYHRLGYQVVVHANGDFAIESVLSAMEKCQAEYPRQDHRHMIIHCQMATDDQLARISKMGIILSFFVNHVHIYGDRHANQFIGPERASRIDPLGASLRAGVRFTLHSDNPVCRVSPLDSMHNAVNRLTSSGRLLGPEQRISAYDALKAYTSDAAYCSFEENIKGTITPGKLADFVVLAQNPLEVEKEKIKEIQILSTIMGGEVVFSQGI